MNINNIIIEPFPEAGLSLNSSPTLKDTYFDSHVGCTRQSLRARCRCRSHRQVHGSIVFLHTQSLDSVFYH